MSGAFEQSLSHSYLNGSNANFIEALYEQYLADPDAVDAHWRDYFRDLESMDPSRVRDVPHGPIREAFEQLGRSSTRGRAVLAGEGMDAMAAQKQAAVLRLINAYRVRGHQHADTDPLDLSERPTVSDLDPAFHGLTDADLETPFNTGSLFAPDRLTLREILEQVRAVYAGKVGSEYMHITRIPRRSAGFRSASRNRK